jgi:putative sigma-54 modulation protein
MRIVITGRHLGVTEAMKEYAREKAGKLSRVYDRATKVEVTMDVAPKGGHVVEMVLDATRGVRLVGKAEDPDMYAAVDLAEDKLVRQLVRHKQRLTDHHRGEVGPGGPAREAAPGGAPAPAEETYEDVIERLGEE